MIFLLKMSTYQLKGFFFKVLDENPKIVLHMVILELGYPDPQLHQILKPIRELSCTFLLIYRFSLRQAL